MKIAVGLSGGVDSSVTAALLKEAGHDVVGITMKIWKEGKYRGGAKDACFGPGEADDIARAEALCARIGIPYRVFDCSDEYERGVLDDFRKEYLSGRTPNPCVRCNAFLKFGVLPALARKSGLVFERFATGHYARLREENGKVALYAALDERKDQSYFLYRLKQHQLTELLFPLGGLKKTDVRAIAAKFGLEVKDKPDSQDFYSGDHTELLDTPDRPGKIVDAHGTVLGTHRGFWHFTVGQRKGLGVAAPHPLYVLDVNPCRNEVVVGPVEDTVRVSLAIVDCSWISEAPENGSDVSVKIRSASRPVSAVVSQAGNGTFVLTLPSGVASAARGQSAVLYREGRVLGGGIIDDIEKENPG